MNLLKRLYCRLTSHRWAKREPNWEVCQRCHSVRWGGRW